MNGYMTAGEANAGHLEMCCKWATITKEQANVESLAESREEME